MKVANEYRANRPPWIDDWEAGKFVSGDDREKLSWSEIDKRRDGARSGGAERPRGRKAQEQQRRESRAALGAADALFSGEKGAAEGAALASAIRDAHGTAGLTEACRAYVTALGIPASVDLLVIFLDSDERELMVPALEQLLSLRQAGKLEVSRGLKSQLRILAQHSDDLVAGLSEDLLE